MFSRKEIFGQMKAGTFDDALAAAIPVINDKKMRIGKLIPVGAWILSDREKIQKICDWRQKSMNMFLTQFESSYERTSAYLRDLSVGQENRIFFLIYGLDGEWVGHLGISGAGDTSFELDNVMKHLNVGQGLIPDRT